MAGEAPAAVRGLLSPSWEPLLVDIHGYGGREADGIAIGGVLTVKLGAVIRSTVAHVCGIF